MQPPTGLHLGRESVLLRWFERVEHQVDNHLDVFGLVDVGYHFFNHRIAVFIAGSTPHGISQHQKLNAVYVIESANDFSNLFFHIFC